MGAELPKSKCCIRPIFFKQKKKLIRCVGIKSINFKSVLRQSLLEAAFLLRSVIRDFLFLYSIVGGAILLVLVVNDSLLLRSEAVDPCLQR